ncbi:XrtA/PEP-CTERM system TPR-repeat protein PrsT [Pseudodesulfovibrio cashew]|uniref:XrtA/PEP-CTERM system TPR-repeat protein PrsT n=1 Tax=Pseudodesulfovibrio cashew TaxID=2678688 RepID=UPI00131AEA0D|nr:XrtA/PEP-CTERM system TPR-repeat protein PrsT [Pseudodesulfovibrio cashew]
MKFRVCFLLIITVLSSALYACGQGPDKDLMSEGKNYMAEKNYQGAIVIFKTALDNSPENMEARFALGKAYLMSGKLDQAEKAFEKYARQNPYDSALLLENGRLKLFRQDFQGAFDYLSEFVSKVTDSAEGYTLLGRAAWGVGKYDDARKSFAKAIELEPAREDSQLALAQLYVIEGNEAEAAKIVDGLMEREPNNRNGLYFKARLAQMHGDTGAYKSIFKQIVKAHPTDAYAKYTYAKGVLEDGDYAQVKILVRELSEGAPKVPFGKKLEGMLRYSLKDYGAAVNAFHEAIAIRPDAESYFFLGMSYYGMGDLETAITQLRIAADRSQKFLKAREMISLILLQQKRYNESIAEARKILEVDSNNVIASVIRGDAYLAKGDTGKALEQLKEITEKDPHFAAAFMKMGALHYSMGDMEESEAALKGALKAAPDNLRPRLVLSNFYLRNGNKDLARTVLEEGLSGKKEDVALYVYLARMELMERNPDKARTLLSKAKALDVKNPTAYMMLASMALAEKKSEDALIEYDELLTNNPNFLRAQLAKAVVLDTLGRADEAEATYKEAVKSGNPSAYLAYAGSKLKSSNTEASLAILNEGLKENPNDESLIRQKAETLFGLKRFDEVLAMSDNLEKLNRNAGLGLRVRTFVLMKDFDKAVATAREICDFAPKSPEGYLVLADVNMRANHFDDWRKALEEGVGKCGPSPVLLQELGKYYSAIGNYNKALTYLDSVIKQNDKAFKAYSLRGDVYGRLGNRSKAVEDYTKALELSDRYVPALNNLAMVYLDDERTSAEALRLAYKAYLQMPWSTSVMDTFGYALAVNGKQDAAVSILEKAASIEADNPDITYHLGYAYQKAGKNEQAIAKLEQVANCDGCDMAADAKKLLKKIKGD